MKTRHVVRQKDRRAKTRQRQPTKQTSKQTRLKKGGRLKTRLKHSKKKQTYVVR